jgi:hypothetical protein
MSTWVPLPEGFLHQHVNLELLPPDVAFRETTISPDGATSYTDHKSIPGQKITLEEPEREATESSMSIAKDYTTLNKTLKRHEDVIRTRWAKKTRTQRKSILENAWLSRLSIHHRPDLEETRRGELEIKSDDNKKDVYIWHHINLENLLTPVTIPRFLYSRGRNPPRTFPAWIGTAPSLAAKAGLSVSAESRLMKSTRWS